MDKRKGLRENSVKGRRIDAEEIRRE
jgi:hypothetical protein